MDHGPNGGSGCGGVMVVVALLPPCHGVVRHVATTVSLGGVRWEGRRGGGERTSVLQFQVQHARDSSRARRTISTKSSVFRLPLSPFHYIYATYRRCRLSVHGTLVFIRHRWMSLL